MGASAEGAGAELTALVAGLFDAELAVVCAEPRLQLDALHPEERRCVAEARPRRQAQFSTGRACAREALARLGLPSAPLPARTDFTTKPPIMAPTSTEWIWDFVLPLVTVSLNGSVSPTVTNSTRGVTTVSKDTNSSIIATLDEGSESATSFGTTNTSEMNV